MRYFVLPVVEASDNNGITSYPTSDVGRLPIVQMIQYPVSIKINDIHARVFQTENEQWWIGAKYQWSVDEFPIMGPYDDVETAIVFYRLHGDISRPVFE